MARIAINQHGLVVGDNINNGETVNDLELIKYRDMKLIFLILLFFIFSLLCFAQKERPKRGKHYELHEKEVAFKDSLTIRNFIQNNLSREIVDYIHKNKIKGVVMVKMIINSAGNVRVEDTEIIKGLDPIVDNELKRILNLTKWYPAEVSGLKVARKVVIPVRIRKF